MNDFYREMGLGLSAIRRILDAPAFDWQAAHCRPPPQMVILLLGVLIPEAHAGLAQMYAADPRFTAYYDEEAPGCAVFLRDVIAVYFGGK